MFYFTKGIQSTQIIESRMRIIENTWGNCTNNGKLVHYEVIQVASVSDLVLTVHASKAVPGDI